MQLRIISTFSLLLKILAVSCEKTCLVILLTRKLIWAGWKAWALSNRKSRGDDPSYVWLGWRILEEQRSRIWTIDREKAPWDSTCSRLLEESCSKKMMKEAWVSSYSKMLREPTLRLEGDHAHVCGSNCSMRDIFLANVGQVARLGGRQQS